MLLRLLRSLPALCLTGAILLLAPPARAQGPGVQIGFCPGAPGHIVTITIKVVIACPTPTTLTATAPCDDAVAVMGAVDGGMAGINLGGLPMLLGMGSCPPPSPTPAHHDTWGAIKAIYRWGEIESGGRLGSPRRPLLVGPGASE